MSIRVIPPLLFLIERQENQNHVLFNIKLVSNSMCCPCYTAITDNAKSTLRLGIYSLTYTWQCALQVFLCARWTTFQIDWYG